MKNAFVNEDINKIHTIIILLLHLRKLAIMLKTLLPIDI
jgi:hypothetical protein